VRYLAVFALILVSACSSLPFQKKSSLPVEWQQRASQLQQFPNWQIEARFAAVNGDEAWNGQIIWRQTASHYLIDITGPLNQGAVRIIGNPEGAELRLSDDEQYFDVDAERLLHRHTGMHLPVNALNFWLRAQIDPRSKAQNMHFDEQNQLRSFSQAKWEIEYKRYTQIENLQMPNKIFLRHPEYQVRIVIKDWKLFV